ncbi:MAG: hypothetical protein KA368_24095 [Acidobacteria bacterium]|nr:hypothetical protein [Acidobacteriota bacterium]
MATKERIEQDIKNAQTVVAFVDDMMFLVTPMLAGFGCAVAAMLSDTPTKWLIRASVWLVAGLVRYLAGRKG